MSNPNRSIGELGALFQDLFQDVEARFSVC